MELVQRKTAKGKLGKDRKEHHGHPAKMDYDTLVEMTPTNIKDAQPGLAHIKAALRQGRDVVTSNKGPLALKFQGAGQSGQEERCRAPLRSLGGRGHAGHQPGPGAAGLRDASAPSGAS